MASYLVVKDNNETKSYKCKSTYNSVPYLKVDTGFLDLTTETTTGLQLKVKINNSTYRPVCSQTATTTVETTVTTGYDCTGLYRGSIYVSCEPSQSRTYTYYTDSQRTSLENLTGSTVFGNTWFSSSASTEKIKWGQITGYINMSSTDSIYSSNNAYVYKRQSGTVTRTYSYKYYDKFAISWMSNNSYSDVVYYGYLVATGGRNSRYQYMYSKNSESTSFWFSTYFASGGIDLINSTYSVVIGTYTQYSAYLGSITPNPYAYYTKLLDGWYPYWRSTLITYYGTNITTEASIETTYEKLHYSGYGYYESTFTSNESTRESFTVYITNPRTETQTVETITTIED